MFNQKTNIKCHSFGYNFNTFSRIDFVAQFLNSHMIAAGMTSSKDFCDETADTPNVRLQAGKDKTNEDITSFPPNTKGQQIKEASVNCKKSYISISADVLLEKHIRPKYKGGLIHKNVKRNQGVKVEKADDLKEYNCDQCDYSSKSIYYLELHKCRHSEEKPYHCEQCNFSTKHRYYIKRHKNKHFEEKRYHCEECNFAAHQLSDLRRHIWKHTEEKPLTCNLCQFSTKHAVSLKLHAMRHSGKTPYECDECTYNCRSLSNLKRHKVRHHSTKSQRILTQEISIIADEKPK